MLVVATIFVHLLACLAWSEDVQEGTCWARRFSYWRGSKPISQWALCSLRVRQGTVAQGYRQLSVLSSPFPVHKTL